jgi:hypothetical protein
MSTRLTVCYLAQILGEKDEELQRTRQEAKDDLHAAREDLGDIKVAYKELLASRFGIEDAVLVQPIDNG